MHFSSRLLTALLSMTLGLVSAPLALAAPAHADTPSYHEDGIRVSVTGDGQEAVTKIEDFLNIDNRLPNYVEIQLGPVGSQAAANLGVAQVAGLLNGVLPSKKLNFLLWGISQSPRVNEAGFNPRGCYNFGYFVDDEDVLTAFSVRQVQCNSLTPEIWIS